MNSFLKVGQTNKLPKGGDVMLEFVSVAVLGLCFYKACLMNQKDKGGTELINQVIKGKGYVKHYDEKSKTYIVELSVGSNFTDLEKAKGGIENALKQDVEVINQNYRYFIKLSEPKVIPTLVPFDFYEVKNKSKLKVAVAQGSDGLIFLDFTKVPHTLVAGSTGWGKSIFTKNLILQIINNFQSAEFELFDFKAGIELGDFKDLKQTKSFTIRPHEAEEEINRIYGEIEDRFATITATNSKDWIVFNQKNHEKMIPKFVVMEEFTILLSQSSDISITLTKCLAIARAVGVFFIFTSQRFDSKIIDSRIKANIDNRVCFHTADATNSRLILDVTGAEKLKIKGRCLISIGGEITEGQTLYAREDDVRKYTKSHIKDRSEVLIEEMTNNKGRNKKSLQRLEIEHNGGVELWV